jgi:hypothetical protein
MNKITPQPILTLMMPQHSPHPPQFRQPGANRTFITQSLKSSHQTKKPKTSNRLDLTAPTE